MLGQAGLHLHTFPEVVFSLDKWTMQGYPCVLDKTPNRQLDIHVSRPQPVQHQSYFLNVNLLLKSTIRLVPGYVWVVQTYNSREDFYCRPDKDVQHAYVMSIYLGW